MDRHRPRLLSAAAIVLLGATISGCGGWLRPSRTIRPSARSFEAPPDRAAVVVTSDAVAGTFPMMTRIIDEDAEAVADVPDGSHAVFMATPGAHVYAAFTHELPLEEACVGALRATFEAGKTYAFHIEKGQIFRVWKRSCYLIELAAVRSAELPALLETLSPRLRVELVPAIERTYTFAEDLDVRESVLGTARLRMIGSLPSIGGWSPGMSVLAERDGIATAASWDATLQRVAR